MGGNSGYHTGCGNQRTCNIYGSHAGNAACNFAVTLTTRQKFYGRNPADGRKTLSGKMQWEKLLLEPATGDTLQRNQDWVMRFNLVLPGVLPWEEAGGGASSRTAPVSSSCCLNLNGLNVQGESGFERKNYFRLELQLRLFQSQMKTPGEFPQTHCTQFVCEHCVTATMESVRSCKT